MIKIYKSEEEIQNDYLSSEDIKISCIFCIFIVIICLLGEFLFYKTIKYNYNLTFNIIIIIIVIISIYCIFNKLIKKQVILKIFTNILFPNIVVIVFLSFLIQTGRNVCDRINEDVKKEKAEINRINEEWKSKGYKCIEKQLFYETETKNMVSLNKECDF